MRCLVVGCAVIVGLASAEYSERTEHKWLDIGIDTTVSTIVWMCNDYTRDMEGVAPWGFDEAFDICMKNVRDDARTKLAKGYPLDEAKRYYAAFWYTWRNTVHNFLDTLEGCKARVCLNEDPECFRAYRSASRHAKGTYKSDEWRQAMWTFYQRDCKGDSASYEQLLHDAEQSLLRRLDEIAEEDRSSARAQTATDSIIALARKTDSIPVPPRVHEDMELGQNDYNWGAHDGSTYVYTSITYEYDYSQHAPEGKVILSLYSTRRQPDGAEQETREYLLVPKRSWEKTMQKLHDGF